MTALAAPTVAPRPRPDEPRFTVLAMRGHRYARIARLHIKNDAARPVAPGRAA